MIIKNTSALIIVLIILGIGITLFAGFKKVSFQPGENLKSNPQESRGKEAENSYRQIDFSTISSTYRFSSQIPKDWRVEFVSETAALNIYDIKGPESTNLEKSQIFIRQFQADNFLTLNTVKILSRDTTTVKSHEAIRYEIIKKPEVAAFLGQPSWRSKQHKLIDIRFSSANPGLFYVIAYNPSLNPDIFEKFIQDIQFHNDPASFVSPIDKPLERADKKPFGILISPDNSPIIPERFSGYHTGVDFEILAAEKDKDMAIVSICGGQLRTKETVSGYGGIVVQDCILNNDKITAVYGHLRLSSVRANKGDYLSPNTFVGFLGAAGSSETDGERKHLHLGIHLGGKVDLRGYIPSKNELADWIDPFSYPLF